MSEYRISQEINLFEIADKYAKRLQDQVDEMTLDKAADALAKFGYVKVVRCRDCAYIIHFFHHDDERWQCTEPHQEGDDVKPDAYCWRGKRKEGE